MWFYVVCEVLVEWFGSFKRIDKLWVKKMGEKLFGENNYRKIRMFIIFL